MSIVHSSPIFAPRIPARIAAIVLLAIILSLGGCGGLRSSSGFRPEWREVTFTFRSPAERVCLGGDFNEWSRDEQCLILENGVWTIRLKLKPGRYRYAFFMGGDRWVADPEAVWQEDDGFGTKNSVLIVE